MRGRESMPMFDIPEEIDEIKIKKDINDFMRKIQEETKPEKCILCGKEQTSFCNSHSVPKMVLKNIAKAGKLYHANKLIEIPVVDKEKGIDDTPVHKAVREGFVNMIIHADYLMDAGVLKVIKRSDSFEFTNPGILKLPLEDIYRGGNSKSRNPHMQTMLRLVGFGDNAGSGFPTILAVWKSEGWIKPELIEDTNLDQVTLVMKMEKESDDKSAEKSAENSAENSADLKNREGMALSERHQQILAIMEAGIEYSTEQVAEKIGLKGPRTRQLLNELVNKELLACIGTTKRRRYIKPVD